MDFDSSAAIELVLPPGESVRTTTIYLVSPTHPRLTPPLGGITRRNFWMKLIPHTGEGWGYCMVEIARPYVQSFRLIHPCDGQTDGFAIAYSALSMLSRANKRL